MAKPNGQNGFENSDGWNNWNKDWTNSNNSNNNANSNNSYKTNGFFKKPNNNNNTNNNKFSKNDWNNKSNYNDWNSNSESIDHPPADIKVIKDFYINSKSNQKSHQEIESFRQQHQITVADDVPPPMLSFSDYPWPEKIEQSFKMNGFTKPTPIQSQGWPIALSGKDLVGIAQTGSGKTMAFMLPAFIHIDGQPVERKRNNQPMALILAPTRELAQQIHEVVRQCNNYHRSVCLFGGAPKNGQLKQIRMSRPTIIIATPGRLNDFLDSKAVSVSNISYLVLDEADRMLDMGFEPQIRKIINRIPNTRQTLMWSATWPPEVKKLASEFLVDYTQINIGSLNLHANHNITQIVEVCTENEKKEKLFKILQEFSNSQNKTIIFAETKRKVDLLTHMLQNEGWQAIAIHGDKSQWERDSTLREFKKGDSPILVATDVAARGLDVDDIKYVVNFDFPNCSEDYVHRIGRTGRKNNKGTAYTFFTKENCRNAKELIGVLKEANQVVNPQLYSMADMRSKPDKFRRWGFAPKGNNGGFNNNNHGFKRKGEFNDGPENKRFQKENGKESYGFKSSYPSPNKHYSARGGKTPQNSSYPPQVASTSNYNYNRHN